MSDLSLEELVDRAIALAVLEHPLLQVGIIDENSRTPSWVRLDHIDFEQQVKWVSVKPNQDYEKVLLEKISEELNTPFALSKFAPMWRATVLKHANQVSRTIDVIFVGNHANGDGSSGKIFHGTLLQKLNAVSNGEAGGVVVDLKDRVMQMPASTIFTMAQEKLLNFKLSMTYVLSEAWAELRPASLVSKSNAFANWAPLRPAPNSTRLTILRTESYVLDHVLKACRLHKTTLTGLLQVLGLLSLCMRLPRETALAFQQLTPISLRRFAPAKKGPNLENTYGNIVTQWVYEFDEKVCIRATTRG